MTHDEQTDGVCPITGIEKDRLLYGDFCGECWATVSPYDSGCDARHCEIRNMRGAFPRPTQRTEST